MSNETLAALSVVDGEEIRLRAPRLGEFTLGVGDAGIVEAGDVIGELRVLHRRYRVVVPDGVQGRLTLADRKHVIRAVEFGETLARVRPTELGEAAAPTAAERTGLSDLPEGAVVFEAPMDGQFYRRPSPDEPMFAEVGDVLEPGARFGLIEVMKFFYPVEWSGERAMRVHAFVADDHTAIEAGAPIVVLVPSE